MCMPCLEGAQADQPLGSVVCSHPLLRDGLDLYQGIYAVQVPRPQQVAFHYLDGLRGWIYHYKVGYRCIHLQGLGPMMEWEMSVCGPRVAPEHLGYAIFPWNLYCSYELLLVHLRALPEQARTDQECEC